MMFPSRWWKLLTAVQVAALAVGAGVVAYAAIPGSDGVINGCIRPNGVLRVIDSAASCRQNEKPLNWNQSGPAGPQGPQGPGGPTGSQGPAGPQGPAGFANASAIASTTPVPIFTSEWGTVDTEVISLAAQHHVQITADMQGPATVGVVGTAERLAIDGSPIQSSDVACPAEFNAGGQLTYITPALYCSSGGRAINWSVTLPAGQHTIQSQLYFTTNGVGVFKSVTVHSLTVVDLGS